MWFRYFRFRTGRSVRFEARRIASHIGCVQFERLGGAGGAGGAVNGGGSDGVRDGGCGAGDLWSNADAA